MMHSRKQEKVRARLAELEGMDRKALSQAWEDCYGTSPPPKTSRPLMIKAIAHKIQEKAFGGLSANADRALQQVASTARQMITRFGMSDELGPVALGRAQGGMFLGRDIAAERDFSEETAAMIDKEVSELVDVAYKRATKVLVDNRAVLDELAEMLVEQETVDAEELQELLIKRDVRVAEYV